MDAAKLMWPEDLQNIFGRLNNLPTAHGFAANSKPFVVQEIIVLGGDEDDMIPYFDFGRVTEFKVKFHLKNIIIKIYACSTYFNIFIYCVTYIDGHQLIFKGGCLFWRSIP